MIGPDRTLPLALALAATTFAMPVHAHPLGIGIGVFMMLLVAWPFVCVLATVLAPRGKRAWALLGSVVLYPVTYFLLETGLGFVYTNRTKFDDAQLFVLFGQGAAWVAAFIWIYRLRAQV